MFLLGAEEIIFQVECHFNCVGWRNFPVAVNKIVKLITNYTTKNLYYSRGLILQRFHPVTQNGLEKIKERVTNFHYSGVRVVV